jgi:iron complex outermembrane receptor protein
MSRCDENTPGMRVTTLFFRLRKLIVFVAMASAVVCYGATAEKIHPIEEQQLKSMSLEQLGNVEVTTASKQPEEVWKTPAAVFVITSEDIRRSSATTLPGLLRLVPGVQVSRSQSDEWGVGIRGFTSGFSKDLLVLIDGRSVYTPLFEGVYWDVQDLPLEDIDRIEVIRGPAGAVWVKMRSTASSTSLPSMREIRMEPMPARWAAVPSIVL